MGYRFSVLTVLPTCIARDTEAVYEKGFDMTRLASVRSIGIWMPRSMHSAKRADCA